MYATVTATLALAVHSYFPWVEPHACLPPWGPISPSARAADGEHSAGGVKACSVSGGVGCLSDTPNLWGRLGWVVLGGDVGAICVGRVVVQHGLRWCGRSLV